MIYRFFAAVDRVEKFLQIFFILPDYFVNQNPMNQQYSSSGKSGPVQCDAINQKPADDASSTVLFDGIKRYATAADMIADKTNNNYDSFVETYWDCTSGMPVWKRKA